MRSSYTNRNRRLKKRGKTSGQIWGLFIAIFAFLLVIWTVAGPFGMWKLHKLKQHRKLLYAKVIDLSKDNTRLKEQIQAFGSDRKLQEEMVRKKLGWIRKNELLYKFIGQSSRSR